MNAIDIAVRASLEEDVGSGDITAELISPEKIAVASIITHEPAIFCGIPWAESVYHQLDPTVKIHWYVKEGETISANQKIAELTGHARVLVTGERCALNWLQTLSGTATKVARYAEKISGMRTKLLDTRKTIPGLRHAQKYAVQCGGGVNHRMGLYDAYLIKENHIISCGSIAAAVAQARKLHPDKSIEVEVENLQELEQALDVGVKIILLDNFNIHQIQEAVRKNQGRAKLEVSGGVNFDNILQIAETGVDFISVGALTKHVRAIDMAMRFH